MKKQMNYYIITDQEEHYDSVITSIYHEFRYKTGINKTPQEIKYNKWGDLDGGICFRKENIFCSLIGGYYIRKVSIPKEAKVYQKNSDYMRWIADKVILGKRERITLKTIKRLEKEGADIHVSNDYVLVWASENNHLDIVKYMISKGANIEKGEAFWWAFQRNHLNIMEYLYSQGANIHADKEEALRYATKHGHLDMAKFLVSKCADIHIQADEPLRNAAEHGHWEIVKFLISNGADVRFIRKDLLNALKKNKETKKIFRFIQSFKSKLNPIHTL